jgi:hypothetical protein
LIESHPVNLSTIARCYDLNHGSLFEWYKNDICDCYPDKASGLFAGQKVYEVNRETGERVELAFENHRIWDLIRWRIAIQVMDNTVFSALLPCLDYKDREIRFRKDTEYAQFRENIFFWGGGGIYYQPIPGVAQNDILVQNPGF